MRGEIIICYVHLGRKLIGCLPASMVTVRSPQVLRGKISWIVLRESVWPTQSHLKLGTAIASYVISKRVVVGGVSHVLDQNYLSV